jgi:hypothetical protein
MKHLQWSEGAKEIHLVEKDGRKAREKRREMYNMTKKQSLINLFILKRFFMKPFFYAKLNYNA